MPLKAKKTAAGNYRTFVRIERLKQSATVNAAGHIDETDPLNWEPFSERYVQLKTAQGSEFLAGDQLQARNAVEVYCRSDEVSRAITAGMRVLISGVVWSVAEPPNDVDFQRQEVVFRCIATG